MPPRYAYWTILVDDQPTAFRAGSKEDLLPTFNRLKEKNPSAVMMWFQNGKLWPSRVDAQEAMIQRGLRGREGDRRQGGLPAEARGAKVGSFRDRKSARPDWKPKFDAAPRTRDSRPRTQDPRPRSQAPSPKPQAPLDWKPKGEFVPAPKRSERPDWKPKSSFGDRDRKSDWKPKSFSGSRQPATGNREYGSRQPAPDNRDKHSFDRERKPEWKPKGSFTPTPRRPRKPEGEDRGPRRERELEWTPKGEPGSRPPATGNREYGSRQPAPGNRDKRKWVPKEEYKRSQGIEAKRDKNWRPGGEHKDPRQKYKDAKKAKWTRFKQAIRSRSTRGKKNEE